MVILIFYTAQDSDIFSLAVTNTHIISASGSPDIKIYATNDAEFPLAQTLNDAHNLGCHHLTTSRNGKFLASTGFSGETKIWACDDGLWSQQGTIEGAISALRPESACVRH